MPKGNPGIARNNEAKLEINGTYYLYGLGCPKYPDCFTCTLPDCQCKDGLTFYDPLFRKRNHAKVRASGK